MIILILSVTAVFTTGCLIYFLDIAPSVRTAELRRAIEELNKLTLSGAGEMRWTMVPKERLSSERSLLYNLTYVWSNDDVLIELVLQQRHKSAATIVLTLGGKSMPTWHYGPKAQQPLSELLPNLRQILGENDIRVVPDSSAA